MGDTVDALLKRCRQTYVLRESAPSDGARRRRRSWRRRQQVLIHVGRPRAQLRRGRLYGRGVRAIWALAVRHGDVLLADAEAPDQRDGGTDGVLELQIRRLRSRCSIELLINDAIHRERERDAALQLDEFLGDGAVSVHPFQISRDLHLPVGINALNAHADCHAQRGLDLVDSDYIHLIFLEGVHYMELPTVEHLHHEFNLALLQLEEEGATAV
mmetsp:Transcript_84194/g.219935  ORF Transcript_84194/g.219935 Transcript_84194/m.219935 type:complete len:214 (-) Transcript_84194:324-965(-)